MEVRPWALQAGLHTQVSALQGQGARCQLAAHQRVPGGVGQEEMLQFVLVFLRCQLYLLGFTHQ